MDNHVLEEKVLQKVMNNIPVGLVVSKEGKCRRIFFVNQAAYEMLGYSREEYIKLVQSGWSRFMGMDLKNIMKENRKAILQGNPFDVTAPAQAKDGTLRWLLMRLVVKMEDGPVCYASIVDVTEQMEEQKKQEQEQEYLKECATRDSFTRLLNRGTMEHLIKSRLKEGGKRHAYIAMDVDDFKQINDAYGHTVGDGVILELSNILMEHFGEEAYVGRMGGDEFAVFLSDVEDEQHVEHQAKHILRELRSKQTEIGLKKEPSVSIGIAFYPEAGTSFSELYHRADEALYKVKNNTKNGVAVF